MKFSRLPSNRSAESSAQPQHTIAIGGLVDLKRGNGRFLGRIAGRLVVDRSGDGISENLLDRVENAGRNNAFIGCDQRSFHAGAGQNFRQHLHRTEIEMGGRQISE